MEITGTIRAMTQVTTGTSKTTGKEWKKQGFVIENNSERIATSLYFEVFNDRIEQMTAGGMKVDAVGKLFFDVLARQYNGRWFNEIRGWKWEPGQSWEQAQAQAQPQQQPTEDTRVDAVEHLKQLAAAKQAAPRRSHTGGSNFFNDDPKLPF